MSLPPEHMRKVVIFELGLRDGLSVLTETASLCYYSVRICKADPRGVVLSWNMGLCKARATLGNPRQHCQGCNRKSERWGDIINRRQSEELRSCVSWERGFQAQGQIHWQSELRSLWDCEAAHYKTCYCYSTGLAGHSYLNMFKNQTKVLEIKFSLRTRSNANFSNISVFVIRNTIYSK